MGTIMRIKVSHVSTLPKLEPAPKGGGVLRDQATPALGWRRSSGLVLGLSEGTGKEPAKSVPPSRKGEPRDHFTRQKIEKLLVGTLSPEQTRMVIRHLLTGCQICVAVARQVVEESGLLREPYDSDCFAS